MNRQWAAVMPYIIIMVSVMLLGDWAPGWLDWVGYVWVWIAFWLVVGEWARNKFAPQRRHNDRPNP